MNLQTPMSLCGIERERQAKSLLQLAVLYGLTVEQLWQVVERRMNEQWPSLSRVTSVYLDSIYSK